MQGWAGWLQPRAQPDWMQACWQAPSHITLTAMHVGASGTQVQCDPPGTLKSSTHCGCVFAPQLIKLHATESHSQSHCAPTRLQTSPSLQGGQLASVHIMPVVVVPGPLVTVVSVPVVTVVPLVHLHSPTSVSAVQAPPTAPQYWPQASSSQR